LRTTPEEHATGVHRRHQDLPEPFVASWPIQGGHSLAQTIACPTIVALDQVGKAEAQVGERVLDDIVVGERQREGALAGGNGDVIRAHPVEMVGQKDRDLAEATRIVEGFREGLRLTQTGQYPLKLPERAERRAQGEPEIDSLLTRGTLVR